MMDRRNLLATITFGQRVAEEEVNELENYFVETDQWRRLLNGEIDIVYGAKGSGKSALYLLINKKSNYLLDKGIIAVSAENLRGTTVFRSLAENPPRDEFELVGLWKLYMLSLIGHVLIDNDASGDSAARIIEMLREANILENKKSLTSLFNSAYNYLTSLRPKAIELDSSIDPSSSMPTLTGRIVLNEPTPEKIKQGFKSVNELLDMANQAIHEIDFKVWILFDRLDVAFADKPEIEETALRALFRTYLDLLSLDFINMKIFIRSDIWKRLTSSGFREASHITRHTTIKWDRSSLLNLVIRRLVQNDAIIKYYATNSDEILNTLSSQEKFFYKIFPKQIDIGPNKPETLGWMIGRTRDGTKETAPRELIHLLNSTKEIEIRRIERGETSNESSELFTRSSIKMALPDVSKSKLEQTLYAEYPRLRKWIGMLEGEKTSQNPKSLSDIWEISEAEASEIARQLFEIGFFEPKGSKDSPMFWVPFLYRDALNMVQGTAG
jgi:hypothetical protein